MKSWTSVPMPACSYFEIERTIHPWINVSKPENYQTKQHDTYLSFSVPKMDANLSAILLVRALQDKGRVLLMLENKLKKLQNSRVKPHIIKNSQFLRANSAYFPCAHPNDGLLVLRLVLLGFVHILAAVSLLVSYSSLPLFLHIHNTHYTHLSCAHCCWAWSQTIFHSIFTLYDKIFKSLISLTLITQWNLLPGFHVLEDPSFNSAKLLDALQHLFALVLTLPITMYVLVRRKLTMRRWNTQYRKNTFNRSHNTTLTSHHITIFRNTAPHQYSHHHTCVTNRAHSD